MTLVSHQTIILSKGKHDSLEDGVCVMELASMLAGEPFDDHPQSVCPVIGAFLRAYNDRIDDGRRQDLYAYAAEVVGSRASQDVQDARAERLSAWALELQWSGALQRLVPARLRALVQTPPADLVGSHAVCAIPQHNDNTHAEVLALIDELLRIGACKQPTTQPLEEDEANARLRQSSSDRPERLPRNVQLEPGALLLPRTCGSVDRSKALPRLPVRANRERPLECALTSALVVADNGRPGLRFATNVVVSSS